MPIALSYLHTAIVSCYSPTCNGTLVLYMYMYNNTRYFLNTAVLLQKINFDNNIHLSLTLAALSIGLWWLFDRSPVGLVLGIIIATLATFVTQVLVAQGVFW